MPATEELAAFAIGLESRDVPAATRAIARAAILDTLGCAVAARGERVAAEVRAWVLEEGGEPNAWLWGTAGRTSPARAALANGTAAHALDFDDVSWAMNGHPTVALLPAVLAVADARGASGEEALVAYVAGFEVLARTGEALSRSHYEFGWHPTQTLGALGATAAAGRLLGLDPAALRRAFGLAVSQLAGTRMNFGFDAKPLHAGLAAQVGVFAASLAARGVTAREDGLEADMGFADLYGGARPLEIGSLGRPFALERPGVEFKPYPSCRFTHRVIDAALALRERNAGATPERIDCAIDPFAQKLLIHPRPRTGLEAKFSLPYCAAVAWLDGWPGLDAFSDARAARDDVQSLLRRVEVRDATDSEEEVAIAFESGERDVSRVRFARGSPEQPLAPEERIRKVRGCLEPVLGTAGAAAVIDAVERLESLPLASALGATLAPEGDAT